MPSIELHRAKHPEIRADFTIDQHWDRYTREEHATWRTLYRRMEKILPGRACDEFLHGLKALKIGDQQIPDMERLSDELYKLTRWRVVAVPSLVPDDVFFEHLANRRFPAGFFIRKPDQLDYIEEPDVFHDVFGHVPMLALPVFADYMEAYGKGGLRAGSWRVDEFGAALLVHRRIRIGREAGRFAALRLGDRFFECGIDLLGRRQIAQPDWVRSGARDADEVSDRRFSGELFCHRLVRSAVPGNVQGFWAALREAEIGADL